MEFQGNQFLDPATCEYEVLGFFEELWEPEFNRFLGQRNVQLDRPLGEAGRKEYTFTEDLLLTKGHREGIRVRASKKKPIKAYGVIQIICGKIKAKV